MPSRFDFLPAMMLVMIMYRRIPAIAADRGIDLVFAATRHEDVQTRFFAGTLARRLSIALPCAVALVRVVHLGRIHPLKIGF